VGIAISTTLLSRRAQVHQASLVAHVTAWDPETAERQVLAFIDDFRVLAVMYTGLALLVILMHRGRGEAEQTAPARPVPATAD
jgi:hypothetical protein